MAPGHDLRGRRSGGGGADADGEVRSLPLALFDYKGTA